MRSAQVLALQIALQARALVQIPFLTRTLGVDDFGALTLAMWMAGIAGPLALAGLQTGFFLHLARLPRERTRGAVGTVLALAVPLAVCVGLAVAIALAHGAGGRWLAAARPFAPAVGLMVAGTALREIAMAAPRAWQDVRFFRANSLGMHYGGFLIGAVLVLRGGGAGGFLLGLAIGCVGGGLAACAYSLRRGEGPARADLDFLRSVARSSVLVPPLALAHMSLQSSDYLFISRYLGAAALGSYGLAYTFASPVLLLVTVLNFTLVPECVARQRLGGAALSSLVERTLAWTWTGALAAVAAAIAVGPAVVDAVAGPAYRAAGELLPVIVAAYAFFTVSQVLHLVRSALLANVRRTAAIAAGCAALNAAGNAWLVPTYGLRGAAAATLAGYLLYFLGMTTALDGLMPAVSGRRPWPLVAALAALPVALLLAPSVALRAIAVLVLAVLAWRTAPRGEEAQEDPALSGAIGRALVR